MLNFVLWWFKNTDYKCFKVFLKSDRIEPNWWNYALGHWSGLSVFWRCLPLSSRRSTGGVLCSTLRLPPYSSGIQIHWVLKKYFFFKEKVQGLPRNITILMKFLISRVIFTPHKDHIFVNSRTRGNFKIIVLRYTLKWGIHISSVMFRVTPVFKNNFVLILCNNSDVNML